MNANYIGERIAEGRKAAGLSQSALAERLSISAQAVSKWERGESLPDILMLNTLAHLYGKDLNYFSTDTQTPNTNHAPQPRTRNMSQAEWRDTDFSRLTNLADKFNYSNIINCLFNGTDFSNTTLKCNNIIKCSFDGANFYGCAIIGSNINNVGFENANMTKAELKSCKITSSNFNNTNLSHSLIKYSNLVKTTLQNVTFIDTEFNASSFVNTTFETNLTDCQFIGCSHKSLTFQNVHFANTMFKNTKLHRATFKNCTADPISYNFLKSAKAPLTEITLLP